MSKSLSKMLGNVPIFQSCSDKEIEQVSNILMRRKVNKRDLLFHEGESCDVIYLIEQGRVKVYKTTEGGREQIVNLLGKGDLFPHVGWYGEGHYPATAEVLEDGHLYFMYVSEFIHILETNPPLTLKLLQSFDVEIRELQSRLSNVLSGDMSGRILNVLYSLAKKKGSECEEGYALEIDLTHQDIANMVGTTRETTSRVISQLKKDGKLEMDQKTLFIKVK